MSPEKQCFTEEDLSIQVSYDGDSATVEWSGMSEIQSPELSVGPFLKGLAPRLQGKKVTMDFRQLEYINSATLQPILSLIKELDDNKIDTVIKYDKAMESQRITFRCIIAITQPLTHITVVSA
ncbi:MAG: hypothetical protein U1A78_35445 [Polyangia bacterium]